MKDNKLTNLAVHEDCAAFLRTDASKHPLFDLTFFDPPFNQGKEYGSHNDAMTHSEYWDWMEEVCTLIRMQSSTGAAIYFMQREKNTEAVLQTLRNSGWVFQNLIIWKKKTSAVPSTVRFGKSYQVIAFATSTPNPRVFNRLRINPPLPPGYKQRDNGILLTDVWDDIRELTSGYFAGDEALRNEEGTRLHKQQSPIALLLRILLSSSNPGDVVFDPFAGTGTTLVTASQLGRHSIGVENDRTNYNNILQRLRQPRDADMITKYHSDYVCTPSLTEIWPTTANMIQANGLAFE